MNSVNEAIHFNVPLVVLPHGKDQPIVAQRLVELNAGYRLAKETVNASLRSAVDEVVRDDSYKKELKKSTQVSSRHLALPLQPNKLSIT